MFSELGCYNRKKRNEGLAGLQWQTTELYMVTEKLSTSNLINVFS